MIRKEEADIPILSNIWGAGKEVGSAGLQLLSEVYKQLDKYSWILLPGAGLVTVAAAVNALKPSAVADNADKYVALENIKSSLGRSIREKEAAEKKRLAEAAYNGMKRHDNFLG